MTFRAVDIGTSYDLGLATRPNLDGSTLTFPCQNENGEQVSLSQVAFMFLTDEETEESVDLIRKDQLIRLSSPNLIDREFTMYPQATQGNWVGGETQRIFTDPTAYYQGRGLIWPTSSFVPVLPAASSDIGAMVDDAGNVYTATTSLQGWLASGYLANAGVGVLHSFRGTAASITASRLFFTITESASQKSGNIASASLAGNRPRGGAVVNGLAYYTLVSDANIYQVSYTAGQAFNAATVFATLPAFAGGLVGGYIGKNWVLVALPETSVANPVVRIYLGAAGTFVDVVIPPSMVVTSAAIVGSTVYIAGNDGIQSILLAYDVVAQQVSTAATFPGTGSGLGGDYPGAGGLMLVQAQGSLFILAYSQVGPIPSNAYLTIDLYLYSNGLQFISRLNNFITGLPPNLTYASPIGVSNLAAYGQYVFFAVRLSVSLGGRPSAVVCAYDVTRGTLFTAIDQFALSFNGTFASAPFLEMGLAITPGADANQAPSKPVLGKVAAGTALPGGAYTIQITWTGSGGTESKGSDPATITLAAGDALLISLPGVGTYPVGATGTKTYLTAAPGGVTLGLMPDPGITLTSPTQCLGGAPPGTSTFGTSGDFTVFINERDPSANQVAPSQVMRMCVFGNSVAGLPIPSGGGRVISSVIDFTSATIKLYRMLVATHEPIPAGTTFRLYAFLDVDGDNLPADTVLKVTNSTAGATVTVLPINTLAKKLVSIADWPSTPGLVAAHPISIAIQAATGWVFTIPLALSDSAMVNGQNSGDYCFTRQDKKLDALAARNFVRQLWRQRGGQCIVTYPDGDSYNAVIAEYRVKALKAKTMNQPGDRKVRYEGKMYLKIAEDL